jgi:hypothetical protein
MGVARVREATFFAESSATPALALSQDLPTSRALDLSRPVMTLVRGLVLPFLIPSPTGPPLL